MERPVGQLPVPPRLAATRPRRDTLKLAHRLVVVDEDLMRH